VRAEHSNCRQPDKADLSFLILSIYALVLNLRLERADC
jgi:hypothetical protein